MFLLCIHTFRKTQIIMECDMPVLTAMAVKCEIARGGFSGERVVAIKCLDGVPRKGLAPTDYCWTIAKKPLPEDEPPHGQVIDGYVAARQYGSKASGHVTIEIPDGEVMIVSADSVIPRPESASHVLV
jgi:hypothetical protein